MFIFKKTRDPENEFDKSEIEYTVNDDDIEIDALITEFGYFLKACGFVFNGTVEIVDDPE
jgi:DNA relaxase NicK